MKIIFLNTWNGRQQEQFKKFLVDEVDETDIFCFQEAEKEMQEIGKEILKDFIVIKESKFITNQIVYNNATYINKKNDVLYKMPVLLENNNIGLGLYNKVKIDNKVLNIINCHGQPYPGDKKDTEARIIQSKELINFIKEFDEPIIIGGDFNLDLNTESVKMFEKNGFLNLIREFNIKTTRNEVSWSKYPDHKQMFADFVFIKNIKVKNFTVPDSDYSDHLAMFLEI